MSTATAPSTTQAMQMAASSGTATPPSSGCKDCVKQGLAILPVVPMAVPIALRGISAGLSELDKHYTVPELKEHWTVLRSLPAGFLYVLRPDLTWDIYVVDRDGMLRMAPSLAACPASANDQPPLSALCKRSGHNVPAQVIAIDPEKCASVWMAFSRHRWTQNVLNDYAKNVGGCRDKRMTKLDVMAAAVGSFDKKLPFGANMSAAVGTVVADYADSPTRTALNGACFETVSSRTEQAGVLALAMARISERTKAKTGAIVALQDDLGVAMAVNAARNAVQVERARVLSAYVRHEFVHRAAAGFKKQCETQGAIQRWNEKYATAYNQDMLDKALKERADKLKPIDERLERLASDWVSTVRGPRLAAVFAHDFDGQKLHEGLQCAVAAAECLHGAGSLPAERSLMQSWINGKVSDPGNVIWRALAGNNKTLLDRLGDTKDLLPPAWDGAKNAWGAADEFFKSLTGTDAALVLRLRAGSNDPVANALAKLLHTVAAVTDAAVAPLGKAAAKAILLSALWTGVRMQPVQQRMSIWQAAMDAKMAAWGTPLAARVRTVRKRNTVTWRYDLMDVVDVVRTRAGVAIVVTRYAVVSVWRAGRWVLTGDVPGMGPAAAAAPGNATAGASPAVHGAPTKAPTNVWMRSMALAREGGANGLLAGGVLVFQALGLTQALKDLEGAGDDIKAVEATAAYFAAMAGMLGAASELTAAAIQVRAHVLGVDLATTRVAGFVRGAAAVGGVLGGLSGFAVGISTGAKSLTLHRLGDEDAAGWTVGVAVTSFIAGGTGIAGALTASGAAAAAAGQSSLIGATLFGLGPAGWTILTVGLVAAGLYFAYQAGEVTDDPVESWLKRSLAGNAPQKLDAAAEVADYNALFSLPLEVSVSGTRASAMSSVHVSISSPALDPQSVLDYRLELTDRQRGQLVVTDRLQVSGGKSSPSVPSALRTWAPDAARLIDMSRPNANGTLVSLRVEAPVRMAGSRDSATGEILKANQHTITKATLTVRYLPLARSAPEWVLPDVSGRSESYIPA